MSASKHTFIVVISLVLLATSCSHQSKSTINDSTRIDLKQMLSSDTLRIATMYGATSYFQYRDEYMGFDFDMAQNLSEHFGVNLKIRIARSENEMIQWLNERKVDIICYNTIETKELKSKFNFTLPQPSSYQVLVQNIDINAVADATQLSGKTIYVRPNSIYHQRLNNLYKETGGIFKIKLVADTVSDDDLIDMVAENKIEYTVAYHNLALLHKSYYQNLNCRLAIGVEQNNGWLVRKESKALNNAINQWAQSQEGISLQNELFEKYWYRSPYISFKRIHIPKGAISPYDYLFRKYASKIQWDWRLIAAIAFSESRFNPQEQSWAGACGLMQLMPHTASNFGLNRNKIFNADANIEAGIEYIKSLDMSFKQIQDKNERIRFILAAYNSGPSHIFDAMMLAHKYGKNPHIWFENVEPFLKKLTDSKYYNDPIVKYGYFSSGETRRYVQRTLYVYEKFKRKKTEIKHTTNYKTKD